MKIYASLKNSLISMLKALILIYLLANAERLLWYYVSTGTWYWFGTNSFGFSWDPELSLNYLSWLTIWLLEVKAIVKLFYNFVRSITLILQKVQKINWSLPEDKIFLKKLSNSFKEI